MDFIKYSQRLLNPFRGAMNIIDYKGAEAVSLDGIHWVIYVKNPALLKDIESSSNIQTSDICYGHWSKDKGLTRGPIHPSKDFKLMEQQGAYVYDFLLEHYKQVPFPFLDNYELWLLDKESRPLALIDSSCREYTMEQRPFLDWRAGQYCCHDFKSNFFEVIKKQFDKNDLGNKLSAGEYLTNYINTLCSSPTQAQWFKRTLDDHGIGLNGHNINNALIGRELNESAFSPFMLNNIGHDNLHINLINDFIQWQSPWLLLLDTLSESQRMILEEQSCKQALVVDKLHHLYPEILDTRFITTARVEATLRKNNKKPLDDEESILTTEHIEFLTVN